MSIEYWRRAINNAAPSYARVNGQLPQRVAPQTLLKAMADTLSGVVDTNEANAISLYLTNTTGARLDYFGEGRQIFRNMVAGVPEDDDAYRERIRRFWSATSSLQTVLNAQYGFLGVFTVLEVPYSFNALDNPRTGPYVGLNFTILPTTTSSIPSFPASSRIFNKSIVVILEADPGSGYTPTDYWTEIFQTITSLKTYGTLALLCIITRELALYARLLR